MGKTNNIFAGGIVGRMGNLVGYQWRGQYCVRTMPSHYRDAQSEAQLAQRALFRQTIAFASKAKRILQLGLRQSSINNHVTECNFFMRINKRRFSLSGNQLSVDYENLQLSEGPVAPVAFYEPRLLDDTTISVDFEKNPLHRVAGPDDGVYLVAYCPELGDFDISAPACRRHNSVTLSLNPYWAGREVHLWGFVRDNAGRASMSQYIGYGTLSLEEAEETEDEVNIDTESTSCPTSPDASPTLPATSVEPKRTKPPK